MKPFHFNAASNGSSDFSDTFLVKCSQLLSSFETPPFFLLVIMGFWGQTGPKLDKSPLLFSLMWVYAPFAWRPNSDPQQQTNNHDQKWETEMDFLQVNLRLFKQSVLSQASKDVQRRRVKLNCGGKRHFLNSVMICVYISNRVAPIISAPPVITCYSHP